jgi:predicted Zn-dependent protease
VNAGKTPTRRPHGAGRNAGVKPRISLPVHRGCKLALLAALVAALAPVLTGCSSALLSAGGPPASLPQAPQQAQQAPPAGPARREHQRILAAYNGAYEDPKLEGVLNQTVAKLIAASERPDLQYRVIILNSASVNAFALPSGNLYVTRGLIAVA